ncbi:MAG: cytochrome o ubiquinol oxidase subunit IV [Buchnera aphidicola (Pentalonia nigronervosa)]|jgi:cytochrome o ubiquinol oxidase operon protein cyoD|uniref:Cytochrome bo(3) ubiquinol oxidase subunit 4 n=1 Tax=Buchnera aphidicola (Pentalonia nigronervosa) TaxID=1309793 RepID=A0A7H1AYU7_9GAMM|nr:MAG: cytochrome o ubiquinol oxidase subunit IV [Buchnera aphidicola (Pentalonia nigronervosa)]
MININKNIEKKIKSYFYGFFLSTILTVIPMLLVTRNIFSVNVVFLTSTICAIVQIFVHFIYFLHLDFSKSKRWSVITLLFITVIVFIIIFGSIWIMKNLNHHMHIV